MIERGVSLSCYGDDATEGEHDAHAGEQDGCELDGCEGGVEGLVGADTGARGRRSRAEGVVVACLRRGADDGADEGEGGGEEEWEGDQEEVVA